MICNFRNSYNTILVQCWLELFKNIAVAIITPTHTKKSFDMGLGLAKKLDANLSVIECVYKIPPKFYFFETKSDKKIWILGFRKLPGQKSFNLIQLQ